MKLPLLGHTLPCRLPSPNRLPRPCGVSIKLPDLVPDALFRMKFETRPDWPTEQDEGLV